MVIIDKYAKFDQRHYVLEYHTMMAGCTTCIKILDSLIWEVYQRNTRNMYLVINKGESSILAFDWLVFKSDIILIVNVCYCKLLLFYNTFTNLLAML